MLNNTKWSYEELANVLRPIQDAYMDSWHTCQEEPSDAAREWVQTAWVVSQLLQCYVFWRAGWRWAEFDVESNAWLGDNEFECEARARMDDELVWLEQEQDRDLAEVA